MVCSDETSARVKGKNWWGWVFVTTLAVLQNFDTRLEEAARNLGASPLRTYFEVTLPLTKPGVMAGAMFATPTSRRNSSAARTPKQPMVLSVPHS